MFFSVVIPTHNRQALLEKLLKSLQNQTLHKNDFEVIVVATENDPAFSITTKWDLNLQILFIPSDPYKGRSAAAKRNYGASLAQGEWIAFTDDDCIAEENWLHHAQKQVDTSDFRMLEGKVVIPEPEVKTLTYKGIQRLSHFGGYQTCNMFYKKNDFSEIGGFDLNFPFYLEDTDLAWSFLDKNKKSGACENAKVSHPVPPPEPKRMLDSAFRMSKMPYLYKKHRERYKKSNMRALPRPYAIFVFMDILFLILIFSNRNLGFLVLLARTALTLIYLGRLFKGCQFTFKEITSTFYYLIICPLISVFQLIKGNIQQGTWIFLR